MTRCKGHPSLIVITAGVPTAGAAIDARVPASALEFILQVRENVDATLSYSLGTASASTVVWTLKAGSVIAEEHLKLADDLHIRINVADGNHVELLYWED